MFDFLRRIRVMQRLARDDRGEELDRVLKAMEEGSHFKGAKGHMLLKLADDRGWVELHMKMGGHRHLSDTALGEAWAERIKRHVRETRNSELSEVMERR